MYAELWEFYVITTYFKNFVIFWGNSGKIFRNCWENWGQFWLKCVKVLRKIYKLFRIKFWKFFIPIHRLCVTGPYIFHRYFLGTFHFDDMHYWMCRNPQPNIKDASMVETITELFSNFAKTGWIIIFTSTIFRKVRYLMCFSFTF